MISEKEIKVKDIPIMLLCTLLGPYGIALLLMEILYYYGDKVIWKR
jgi:hypothetical protein